MDARITKSRLSNLISYDWLKIIATIVVAIFVGVIVLTMVGTRPTTAQEQHFLFYEDLYLSDDYSDTLEEDGIFSYEVLSVDSFEMSGSSTYGQIALSARFAAGQRNMIFSSNTLTDDGETTYIAEVAASCYAMLENVDEYLLDAAEYANSFYGGDYINGELNEEYLSAEFRSRTKGDKRYRTESKILSGIEDEKERISLLRSSLITVNAALGDGTIEKYNMSLQEGEEEKPYAVMIGTKKMSSLSKIMYYVNDDEAKTSDGICACFFTPLHEEYNYMRFESLNYLAHLINTYAVS